MLKTIQAATFSVFLLSSCSVNQNFISSANTFSYANVDEHVETVETSLIDILQPRPLPSKVLDCKQTMLKPIGLPKLDEKDIVNAKTEKEMIGRLLQHIDKLDKVINDTNVIIDKNNRSIRKECH